MNRDLFDSVHNTKIQFTICGGGGWREMNFKGESCNFLLRKCQFIVLKQSFVYVLVLSFRRFLNLKIHLIFFEGGIKREFPNFKEKYSSLMIKLYS